MKERKKAGRIRNASLTVEASLVMPLFLFAVIALLSLMDMVRTYMATEFKLYTTARDLAVYSYREKTDKSASPEEDWIRLKLVYPAKSRGGSLFAHTLLLENHVNVHIFNGWSGDPVLQTANAGEEYVYVTEEGDVYHRKRGCRHLHVTITEVPFGKASKARSKDGGKYYPCPYCAKGMKQGDSTGTVVYVPDYGNRYHTMKNCAHLKRTVSRIPLSQAGGRRPCRECG